MNRTQLRASIAHKVLAVAKNERLTRTREIRLYRQPAGTISEADAQMAYRQAVYNLQRRRAQLEALWSEYDKLPPDQDEIVEDEEREPDDLNDEPPPDVGPPGSGAIITEYTGFEPGLEEE